MMVKLISPVLLGSLEVACHTQRETKAGGKYGISMICNVHRAFVLGLLCPGPVASLTLLATKLSPSGSSGISYTMSFLGDSTENFIQVGKAVHVTDIDSTSPCRLYDLYIHLNSNE